ncbi:ribonuclease Z [Candidatus Micrarchaeota archaeon]|nr:ribonuclease Z [Candidatus Micrarchaeota archaeon]
MIKITFLGTSGATPSPERGMPSVAIHAKELFLFDCGEGTQRQMMKYKVGYGSVKAIFISHLHMDHFLGIYGLLETLHLNSPSPKPIKIFAPRGFENLLINRHKFVDVISIKEGVLYENDQFEVHAFRVDHGCDAYGFILKEKSKRKFDEKKAHSLGLKGRMFREIQEKGYVTIDKKKIKLDEVSRLEEGKKIVYSGDTRVCESLAQAAKDSEVLINEATFSSELENEAKERFHCTALGIAKLASKSKVKKLVLTHISPRYKDGSILLKEASEIYKNVVLAEDGMVLDL